MNTLKEENSIFINTDRGFVLSFDIETTIDARGLSCPMPLLKAKQALSKMPSGSILEVLATDSGSYKDFHVFARQARHELLLAEELNKEYRYLLKKG